MAVLRIACMYHCLAYVGSHRGTIDNTSINANSGLGFNLKSIISSVDGVSWIYLPTVADSPPFIPAYRPMRIAEAWAARGTVGDGRAPEWTR